MEEWKEYRYTDLATIIGGGTPKTSVPEYWSGEIPWLSVKDFVSVTKYVYDTEKHISELGLLNSSTKLLEKNDIVISARGTVGAMAMIPDPMCFNQSCFGLRGNNIVDKNFLYYLTRTKVDELRKTAHGSVFDTITRETFDNLRCLVPPLQTQQKIGNILSSLDSKIELNKRINDNLEQQAQALFKSWFVDFEPFKDGKFVDSELGMIPEGWRVGNLLDIAKLYDAKRKPLSSRERENMKKIYPYYGATSIMDYVDKYIFDGTYLLMGEDGSVMDDKGYPYLQYVFGKFWSNNHAHVMQGKNNFSTEMLHCLLLKKNISPIVTGAVQAKISQANMRKILITQPPHEITIIFSSLIKPIYEIRKKNELENQRLSILRDTLLPKLMFGELKINDINN